MGDIQEVNALRLRRHFAARKLHELPQPSIGHIVTIPSSMSIQAAAKTLADLKIQSAPIRSETAEGNEWWQVYHGVLDMYQLLEFALYEAQHALTNANQEQFTKALVDALNSCTVSDLRSVDDYSTLRHLPMDSSILDAMELIAKFDAKRIAVVGSQPSATFVNFITSSTILERISTDCCCEHTQHEHGTHHQHTHTSTTTSSTTAQTAPGSGGGGGGESAKDPSAKHCLDGLTVADLHLDVPSLCGILSALDTAPVLMAFVTLYHASVRGIAIVNNLGEIVGNLSCSDIHFLIIHPDLFAEVCIKHTTVKDYFAILEKHGLHREPVTCSAHETLASLIHRMMDNHVHRVYIVNQHKVPTGVITVRDVIRALLPHMALPTEEERSKRRWEEDSDMYSIPHSQPHSRSDTPSSLTLDAIDLES